MQIGVTYRVISIPNPCCGEGWDAVIICGGEVYHGEDLIILDPNNYCIEAICHCAAVPKYGSKGAKLTYGEIESIIKSTDGEIYELFYKGEGIYKVRCGYYQLVQEARPGDDVMSLYDDFAKLLWE